MSMETVGEKDFYINAAISSKSTAIESTASKSTASKSTASKSTAIESTAIESTAIESTASKSTASKSTASKSTAIESTAIESTASKSTAIESTASKSTASKSTASKSEEYLGVILTVASADVTLLGNTTMHNSNTCKSTEIVGGGDNSNSLKKEYIVWSKNMRNMQTEIRRDNPEAAEKLGRFLDELESFINNFPGGLLRFIYPSTETEDSTNILGDLEKNLAGKMKVWAFPSSGPNDRDYIGLITDDKGINIAKIYGAEQLGYKNGSGLVSWMPTGLQFNKLSSKLNSLLGYSSGDLWHGESFFAYVVQTFMNVIFMNNQFLPEADRLKIIDNYKKLLECIADSEIMFFEDYKKTMGKLKENNKEEFENEFDRPVKFIQFLAKKICAHTSLENLDLNDEQNKGKYIDLICGVSTFLTGAEHPNQVLLEQWIFDKDKEDKNKKDEKKENKFVIGKAFIGKNNILYLAFHTILQRYIELNSAKSKKNKKNKNDNEDNENDKKEDDTQIKNKNMLNFMLNLAGKFRYKITKFDLSNTETKSEYHFGCQVTSDKKRCRVPTEYNTDISVEELTLLLNEIVDFYDFETKLKNGNCKLDDKAIGQIIKYLLAGRQFHDDTMEKIVEEKKFIDKLIDVAKQSMAGEECCYKNAYEILVNEYFDLMLEKKLIDRNYLSKEKLMMYFENDENKEKIIELDAELVAELGLISKLGACDINEFLEDEDNQENKKKMIDILKLVIGRIDKSILNGLKLKYFDNELLETVILSRYNDLSSAQIRGIDFSKLTLNGQKVLLKKMAGNDFKSFSFKTHWRQNINEEAWKSLNLTDWRKFVYNKILESYETVNPYLSKNQKILQLIPIDILSLFDTEECKNENEVVAFDKFLNDNFDYWSAKQILACGNCPEDKLDRLKNKLKAENGISLSESAVKTFLSLQQIFQKFVKNKNLDNNNLSVEKMLFDFFETQLSDEKNSDNLIEYLKYIFNDGENNYFAAMIIMEEFILLDKNTVDSDSFYLDDDKKQKLLQISEKIKSKLNWGNEEQRKKILQQLFSNISKMNELMISFNETVDKKSSTRFEQFIDIYKSFLNRILSMHANDINEYNIADKVPFYFLDNEKSIKSFCQQFGDKININCFSEMLNAINKVNVENNEYRISNALGVGKVLFMIDTINELKKENSDLDDEHNPDSNKYDGLSGFMGQIRNTVGLICNGYAIDESDNSIENHLKQYDENGEISYDKLDSILCTMFKKICEDKIKVNDFIKKYGKLDEQKLTEIKEATNDNFKVNDNFKAFEKLMLPIIQKDYESIDFVSFVQKYDLLRVIGIENLDANMISMAFDCMHRLSPKLEWSDFVKKYYILDKSNENNIIIENNYHIKGLEDQGSQKVMTEILLNDKDIKETLRQTDKVIILKLHESLLFKNKNENIKNKMEDEEKEIENMCDEIGKYFESVRAIKRAWDSNQRLNVEKLSKIWFAKSYGDTKLKTNKLSTMIETYKDQSTYDSREKFFEIYILRHLSQDTIKQYNKSLETYKKIKDLEAKASNLKEQVTLFYQKLDGETFNKNIDSICKWFQFRFGKTVENQFLMCVNKGKDIDDNFKIFVTALEKINEIYGDDEVEKIYNEYKLINKDKDSVKKFFSSIVNRVHFFENYQTIVKKIPVFDYEWQEKTSEYKFKNAAQKILGDPLESNFDIEKNFAISFSRSIEKLNEVLESLKNKNSNQYDKEIKLLTEIYDKYKSYSDYLYSLRNIKVMFTKKDDKFEFETDFQQIQDILKEINIQDCDVFSKCLNIFKTDVLPGYKSKLKQDTSFSDFVKFIETGITNGYFSDAQIYNMGIINISDENDEKSYTLDNVIKKLSVIVGSAHRDKLDRIAKELEPKNRLEYIVCDSDRQDRYISALRELFLHMGYSKAKTFIKDYDFQVYPEIESQSEYQANTYRKRFNLFGRVLQNALLDSFRDNKYNKIDFKGKFILGECFFGSMLRQACKDEKFNVTTEFDSLFEMIRNRILSVLQYPPRYDKTKFFQGEMNQRLSEVKKLLREESFDISLNEQIACAFLSAHIYICSGHIDGNAMDKKIVDLEDKFYDKIISMLARSTGKEEKFKDIKDVKKWVDGSSLKYFIQGTFNFREIPENERTTDQMELEQTKLIEKYNERILEYILSRTDISVFDVLEIYLDDKNKVVYKFSDSYLLKFFQDKILPAAKIGKKEHNKKRFLTLLKFLKRVKLPEKREWVLDNLLTCAKKLGLLDKNGKFVDEEALKIWIENVLPVFGSIDCEKEREAVIMYITNNLGDNVSVLNLIDILQEVSKREPRLVDWWKNCKDCWGNYKNFVRKLNGPYKPYKNGKKQDTDDVKKKFEDVIAFLNQIGVTRCSPVEKTRFSPANQFNLLNLFPLLDNINEISVDDKNGTKKFNSFDDLKNFCNSTFFDSKSSGAPKDVLCILRFLYAISRIPKDKTLLDVVKEDNYKIDAIKMNCSREVFESAVQALYDCLSKENITNANRSDYINFLRDFFNNIKTDDFLYQRAEGDDVKYQIQELKQGKHVFLTISKIFNLVYGEYTKASIAELSKHIDDTFADERKKMKGCDYRIPILCPMFCELIKNMTIEDILSNEVKFIWKILAKLNGSHQKEFSWCWVDELKAALNAKIKKHLENQEDDQKRHDEAKKILLEFEERKTFDFLDLEPLYDALNFSNLVKDEVSQKLVFKDVKSLENFLLLSTEIKNNAITEYYGKETDKFIYAMSRLPKNASVISILKNMKGKIVSGPKDGIKYASQIDSFKDVVLKIKDEIASNEKKYTENQKILSDTIDLLISFFGNVIDDSAFDSYLSYSISIKKCETSAAEAIVSSIIDTLKILLSKYQFTKFREIYLLDRSIRNMFYYWSDLNEHSYDLRKNSLSDISKLMNLKMLNRCHIFEFLEDVKKEGWCKNDKELLNTLLSKMEAQFNQYDKMETVTNYSNNYSETGIELFINNLASDEKYFERVARLAAKICGGYVYQNNSFKRYDVSHGVKNWIFGFFEMFQYVENVNVDILQKIALEHIILNFSKDINVFDVLFLSKKARKYLNLLRSINKIKDTKPKELTTLDKETSQIFVNKIFADTLGDGWAYRAYKGYETLEELGKINFVLQILQEIGLEIHADGKKILCNELRKQREQEQKKSMEEKNKKTENNRLEVNELIDRQNKNENKINNAGNTENIFPISDGNEDIIITDENKINNATIVNKEINGNVIPIHPLQIVYHEKKKNFLKYLFWFLTGCVALICLYFFIKAAIVKAIITLIATVIMLIISIVITKCLNDKNESQVNIDKISEEDNSQPDITTTREIRYQPNQTMEINKERGNN